MTGVRTLTFANRAVLAAAVLAVSGIGWLFMLRMPGHRIAEPYCHMPPFGYALGMWLAMSIAMMAPTTLNWLFAYATMTGRERLAGAVAEFLLSYCAVWGAFSLVCAALQAWLQRAGLLGHAGTLTGRAAGAVLMAAGAIQLAPFSRACLKHCRNPLTYFLEHWDNGPHSGFRFGLVHGLYCLGCCWALMLTGFAMGVMNLAWMALLTLIMCAEKLLPSGRAVAAMASMAVLVWGAILLLR